MAGPEDENGAPGGPSRAELTRAIAGDVAIEAAGKALEEIMASTIAGERITAATLVRAGVAVVFSAGKSVRDRMKETAATQTTRELFVDNGDELRKNLEALEAAGTPATPRDVESAVASLMDAHEEAADAAVRAAATRVAVNSFRPDLHGTGLAKTAMRLVAQLEPGALALLRECPAGREDEPRAGANLNAHVTNLRGYYLQRLTDLRLVAQLARWNEVTGQAFVRQTDLGKAVLRFAEERATQAALDELDRAVVEPAPTVVPSTDGGT